MSDIDSIVSLVPKKKKSIKNPSSLFTNQQNNSLHIHKSNSNPKPHTSNILNQLSNENSPNIINKYSEKILFTKKINEEDFFLQKKLKTNIKILSEKDLIEEGVEDSSPTPVMNLEKMRKPNYLIKSDYIKNKSLTPKENLFQHNLNPIYDFYIKDSEFDANTETNTTKNKNNKNESKGASFTQYYNNFINLNNKDNFENEQMNTISEKNTEKTPMNDEENNMEYNKNFFEKQNIGENTPASLGGDTFSPVNDFFDENIFNYENNFNKSPLNYKQMNVNININNNQQNNNIYYHFPYIVNNVNSGNTNNNYYFNNNKYDNSNKINNDQNDFDEDEYLYEGNNNNIQINEKMNLNDFNNNFGNLNNNINIRQNNFDKNNIIYEQMNNNNNNFQINLDYSNMNDTTFNNNINFNNMRNNNMNMNMNLNTDINSIKLNEILKYKNLENYLNNYPGINNNINSINNNNINYNVQLNNNSSNKNKNFIQNIYNNNRSMINNNNINNNLNYLQMLSNSNNNNNIYNNQFPNLNQENLYFNNHKNISYQNQNQINNNYYPYPNNIINNQNINNFNKNIYNNNFNQVNNIYENNNINLEQILLEMPSYELIDKCFIFAKYQSGCRFLQDYLSKNGNNYTIIKSFFEKILEHIKDLSNGQFSHYFVKKILLYLNEFQFQKLIKNLSPVIEDISTNQYGTKVIQDLIGLIQTDKTFQLMLNIIDPYIKQLIIDLNGTQIIYKLITKSKNNTNIEKCICQNIKEICHSKKGSNFLIKYFDYAEEKNVLNIKKNILVNLKDIITDQFGNYVIQNILLNKNSEIVKNFVDEIKNNIIFFSNNKFASNAVEKCFQNENIKNDVLKLFMIKDNFDKIILDKFGNYVAQRAIAAADDKDRKILLDLLKLIMPELKNKYFGEKLLSKMQFLYPNFFYNYN